MLSHDQEIRSQKSEETRCNYKIKSLIIEIKDWNYTIQNWNYEIKVDILRLSHDNELQR